MTRRWPGGAYHRRTDDWSVSLTKISWRHSGAFFIGALSFALALAQGGPPVAPVRDQVDSWHGVQVHDPYRYMENLADPEVRNWMLAQGAYSRALLDRIESRAQLHKRLTELDEGLGDRRFDITRVAGGAANGHHRRGSPYPALFGSCL